MTRSGRPLSESFSHILCLLSEARLHEAWELARGFAMKSLVEERGLAVVQVLHVPARAARPGPAHVHLLAPARALLPSGFGHFARPLASDEGRALMDAEWAAWRAGHGH